MDINSEDCNFEKVVEKIYYLRNPNSKMDVPSYIYEISEGWWHDWLRQSGDLTFLAWCLENKMEQKTIQKDESFKITFKEEWFKTIDTFKPSIIEYTIAIDTLDELKSCLIIFQNINGASNMIFMKSDTKDIIVEEANQLAKIFNAEILISQFK